MTVVTGRLQGREDLPNDELLNGVRVLRTRSTSFERTKISQRGINYVTYMADSFVRALSIGRPDARSLYDRPADRRRPGRRRSRGASARRCS